MITFVDAIFESSVPSDCYSYRLSEYQGEFTLTWSFNLYEGGTTRILNTNDFLPFQGVAKYNIPVSYRDGYIEIDDFEPDPDEDD